VAVFFIFATELATEMGFTDDWYTDRRFPSVSPSGIISPMDFIALIDGIIPSVKLDNVVVVIACVIFSGGVKPPYNFQIKEDKILFLFFFY
jgi:hypothetical protein